MQEPECGVWDKRKVTCAKPLWPKTPCVLVVERRQFWLECWGQKASKNPIVQGLWAMVRSLGFVLSEVGSWIEAWHSLIYISGKSFLVTGRMDGRGVKWPSRPGDDCVLGWGHDCGDRGKWVDYKLWRTYSNGLKTMRVGVWKRGEAGGLVAF